jgi:DNA-binding FadR family transcriptional regulator
MGLQIQQRNTEAAILARLIQSRTAMDSHIARYLLSLDFEPEDVDRMNLLAERAREGELSAEEEAELDSYLHVGNLLTIMQSKSRVYLRAQEGTPSPQ